VEIDPNPNPEYPPGFEPPPNPEYPPGLEPQPAPDPDPERPLIPGES
jgi:hypothetical protein